MLVFAPPGAVALQQRGLRVTAMAPGEPAQKAWNRGQIRVADQVRADLKLLAVQLPVELERGSRSSKVSSST